MQHQCDDSRRKVPGLHPQIRKNNSKLRPIKKTEPKELRFETYKGWALVYAFANEIIMRETLYPKTQRENSHAVEAYKKKQQSVINDVSST